MRYGCDVDSIGFEVQANGGEFYISKGRVVITMWENNPYNSWFFLKYGADCSTVKNEDWYI